MGAEYENHKIHYVKLNSLFSVLVYDTATKKILRSREDDRKAHLFSFEISPSKNDNDRWFWAHCESQ